MNKVNVFLAGLFACVIACSSGSQPPSEPAPVGSPPAVEETIPVPGDKQPLSDEDASAPQTEQDSGSPQPQADSGPKVPTNQAECLAACEVKHPEGKVLADAITACWTAKCNPSCTHMPDRGPTNVRPANETKVCGVDYLPILTPSPSCSQCTHDECCAEWGACFSGLESDCTKLNECANECWTKFAN